MITPEFRTYVDGVLRDAYESAMCREADEDGTGVAFAEPLEMIRKEVVSELHARGMHTTAEYVPTVADPVRFKGWVRAMNDKFHFACLEDFE